MPVNTNYTKLQLYQVLASEATEDVQMIGPVLLYTQYDADVPEWSISEVTHVYTKDNPLDLVKL